MFGVDWDQDGKENIGDDMLTMSLMDSDMEEVVFLSADDKSTGLGLFGVIGLFIVGLIGLIIVGIALGILCI